MKSITITTEYIKLDQLLKFAGIAYDGAEAKEMILSSLVKVNGEVETRRGRKLYKGDAVRADIGEEAFELIVE